MDGKTNSGMSAGMLGPAARSRPSFWAYLVLLFRNDPTFRGLAEFSLIGAVVLASVTYWPNRDAAQKAQPANVPKPTVDAGKAAAPEASSPSAEALAGVAIQFPPEVTEPTLKNFVVIDIDESAFASSSAADRQKLTAAARAFRGEQFALASEALKTATAKDRNVMFMRAMALVNGDAEAAKQAIPLLRSASEAGQRQAAIILGRQLVVTPDLAVRDVAQGRSLIEAAAHNDRVARRLAGIAYMSGEFGAINIQKARELLQSAADAGDVPAMFSTAFMLGWGIRGPANQSMAADLLRRAAAAGLTDAQVTLGQWLIAQYDRKLIDDPREAIEWLEKALRNGHSPPALQSLAVFYGNPAHPPLWHQRALVYALVRMCSGMNDQWCQAESGWFYREGGPGVPADLVRSAAHYQVAAELGDPNAGPQLKPLLARLGDAEKGAAIAYSQVITAALRPLPNPWHMQYVGVAPGPATWASAPEPASPPAAVMPPTAAPDTAAAKAFLQLTNRLELTQAAMRRISLRTPQWSGELSRSGRSDWRLDYVLNGKSATANYQQAFDTPVELQLINKFDKTILSVNLKNRLAYLRTGDTWANYANVSGVQFEEKGGGFRDWSLRAPDGVSSEVAAGFAVYASTFTTKAFAIRRDGQRFGRSSNEKTVDGARATALKYCGPDCRIYAIDNFTPDFPASLSLPAGVSSEMQDHFRRYLNSAADEKAFAIADDGKQFAWVANKASQGEANEAALKACGSSCKLYAVGDALAQ